ESPENSFEENVVLKTNQEPPQDSDIHQLIEECSIEVPEQQKQNMEKMMLDLVKICHHKQFLCIHDDVDDLIESAFDSKLLSINSINFQRLDKKEQEVKIIEVQPAECRNRIERSLQNLRVIHKSSISLNTSQISSIHEVTPVLSTKELENSLSMGEYEVALEDKRECIVPISKIFPDCDNHSDTFFDSKIDDDISVYDESFEDIEYVEASLLDPEIVSIEEENGVEEENVVQREEEEVDLEDISQVQDVVLRKKLFSITRLISNIESLNDNSHSRFFEDNPSISRPPPEPPDDNFDLEPEVILAVMEDIDEPDEHFNPGGEIFVSTNNEDRVRIRFLILFYESLIEIVLFHLLSLRTNEFRDRVEPTTRIIPRRLKLSCVGYCPGFQDFLLNIGDNVYLLVGVGYISQIYDP
nr:hypothetical protein [Tanacetum cinerariifolium]